MSFGMIITNESIKTTENYITQAQTAFYIKLEMFITTLQMLRKDLAHQTKKLIDNFKKGWTKKVIGLIKDAWK